MERSDHAVSPVELAATGLGCLGVSLTAFIFLVSQLRFEYHLVEGIVSTSAWVNYPEQQDTWLYGIGLVTVAVVAVISYGVWSNWVGWLGQTRRDEIPTDIPAIVLLQLGWVTPLYWLFTRHLDPLLIPGLAGLFVGGNAVIFINRQLTSRPPSAGMVLPSLRVQTQVLILGAGVGMFLLVSPLVPALPIAAFWILLGWALLLWGLWMSGTYFGARRKQWDWSHFAEKSALALVPLAALPLVDVFWSEVNRAGIRVTENVAWVPVWLLTGGSVLVTLVALVWQLRTWSKHQASPQRFDLERGFLFLGAPLLLYALAYDPNIHGALDLFHEAESLVPAQAILAGQVPYRDIVFAHGLLRDPGIGLLAFRVFGYSVAGVRILEHLLTPFSLVLTYYLVLVSTRGRWAILYALLALTGVLPIFYEWRIVPAVAALLALVLYLRQPHQRVWLFVAGLCTFLTLLTSTDVGLVTLVATGAVVAMRAVTEERKAKGTVLLLYLGPVCVGVALVLAYFGMAQGLDAFLNWNWEILRVYRDINGMPYPVSPVGLIQARDAFLSYHPNTWRKPEISMKS